ncbi:thermonuclease family protein [Rhizobium sp. PAMB 3174]
MKLTTAALILAVSLGTTLAPNRTIDGDTIVIAGETIRIANIDTPEIHQAKCDAERRLGLVAKARMKELLASGKPVITRGDHGRMKDRYGRTLAVVSVNGSDIGDTLFNEGLARKWNGKRRPWC